MDQILMTNLEIVVADEDGNSTTLLKSDDVMWPFMVIRWCWTKITSHISWSVSPMRADIEEAVGNQLDEFLSEMEANRDEGMVGEPISCMFNLHDFLSNKQFTYRMTAEYTNAGIKYFEG